MALCETWLDTNVDSSCLEILGFGEIIRRDRRGDAYGGVALYLLEEIHYERRPDLESENLGAFVGGYMDTERKDFTWSGLQASI